MASTTDTNLPSAAESKPEPKPLRVGVVGTGHLGRHHVRILSEMPETELVGIYDLKPEVAADLAERHGTRSFGSPEALQAEVDAMVLAVPTFAHARLGIPMLEAGLHVMVEKPIASSLEEADAMIAARQEGRVLAVGHVEFYNPAVQALLRLGEGPRFLEAQRLSPFTPRSLDVDVILDLMIHDLHILHALDPSEILEVRCTGIGVLTDKVDIASARIELASGTTANLTASRVSAEATRKLRVFLKRRYFSVDYREQQAKGFCLREGDDGTRTIFPEDLEVTTAEPLRAELEAFAAACRGEDVPYADGASGRRALDTALRVRDAAGSAASPAAGFEPAPGPGAEVELGEPGQGPREGVPGDGLAGSGSTGGDPTDGVGDEELAR